MDSSYFRDIFGHVIRAIVFLTRTVFFKTVQTVLEMNFYGILMSIEYYPIGRSFCGMVKDGFYG